MSDSNESYDSTLIHQIDSDLEILEKKIIGIEKKIIGIENRLNIIFITCVIYGFIKFVDLI